MESPKLSIIVPVYNSEKYLVECIDSIINQSFLDLELILINDGSQDGSAAICSLYLTRDVRVKYFEQDNQGVSSARNLGLEHACGEYITFVDSDDWILNDTYESIISDSSDCNFDLASFGYAFCYKNKRKEKRYGEGLTIFIDNEVKSALISADMNDLIESICNKVYKSSIIKANKIIFDIDCSYLEDLRFNIEYFKYVQTFVTIGKCFYCYRQTKSESLSKRFIPNYSTLIKQNIDIRKDAFYPFPNNVSLAYGVFLENKLLKSQIVALTMQYRDSSVNRNQRVKNWNIFIKTFDNKIEIESLYDRVFRLLIHTRSAIYIDLFYLVYYRIRFLSVK
jgi:glycosyltransferase involved in cell wall biosynthesis